MGLTIGSGDVLLYLDRNQQQFQNTVTQLSSGLRVNSAADDPSGNSIATNLNSKALGLQQAAQNVQSANNALNVANGALVSVQNILERVNTLVVQSNSDINSNADLEDIQSEINQLLVEINKIGQNTNFNGLNLLNGNFDTSPGSPASFSQVTSPVGSGSSNVSNYDGLGNSGPLVFNAGVPPGGYFQPSFLVFTVTGLTPNGVDPNTGTTGPGVNLQFAGYAAGSNFGQAPLFEDTTAIQFNSGQVIAAQYNTPDGSSILLEFSVANLTAADVGATIAFQSVGAVAAATGSPLSVNDGGSEGQTVGVTLPTINTNALGITSLNIVRSETVDVNNNLTGVVSSNSVAASYAELLTQKALQSVTTAEAQIGAQQVALNIDDQNDNTAIVNYQASASDITDLNVGQATTKFTQQQLLVNVGTSVLAQMESTDRINTALLIQALVA